MIACGDMHQSLIDTLVRLFFDNFPMFSNSFSVFIHCVARPRIARWCPATARTSCYLSVLLKAVRSRPEPSGAIQNRPDTVRSRPDTVRSRLQLHSDRLPPSGTVRTTQEIQLLIVQKRINCTQVIYSVPSFCHANTRRTWKNVMQKLIRL